MSRPQTQPQADGMDRLKARIAQVAARRDAIKRAIEAGELSAGQGVRQLEPLDRELSELDSAYKQRWDAAQQ